MFSLLTSFASANAHDEFPRLSENRVESEHYEIKRLLRGPIKAVFQDAKSGNVIVVAGRTLWKISPKGLLIDSLDISMGDMYSSGIVFAEDYYIDWIFSGDKNKKKYDALVDGSHFSEIELLAQLKQADQVEFGKKDKHGFAYLHTLGKTWRVDISRHLDRIDTDCRGYDRFYDELNWKETCLKGFTKKPEQLTRASEYSPQADQLKLIRFTNRRYHFEGGGGGQLFRFTLGAALKAAGLPGGLPSSYWVGDGEYQLQHGLETLNFKASVYKEKGEVNLDTMSWLDASEGQTDGLKMIVLPFERAGVSSNDLDYYVKYFELYVLRKKVVFNPNESKPSKNPWFPAITGMTSFRPVTGNIAFYPDSGSADRPSYYYWLNNNEEDRWVNGIPPSQGDVTVAQDLFGIPHRVSVHWHCKKVGMLFRLKLNDEKTAWFRLPDDYTPVEFTAIFDEAEIRAAFNQLNQAKSPIKLEFDFQEDRGFGAVLSIYLSNKKTKIPLKNTHFDYKSISDSSADVAVDKHAKFDLESSQLASARDHVLIDKQYLLPFLNKAKQLVQNPESVQYHVSAIMSYYAELLNFYNTQHDFISSEVLVKHFANEILPRTGKTAKDPGVAYNVSVIASQSLAFALPSQNHAVVQLVFDKILDPNFDIAAQTNPTFLFNLACYYARQHQKSDLLKAVIAARRLGKPESQFLSDTDFTDYWHDADFLKALHEPAASSNS